MKFRKKIKLTAEEKKLRNKNYFLSILSGVFFGIAFPPFPFPFPLFLFIAIIPLLFIYSSESKLSKINKFTYLAGFVFSVISLYWVGSWQEKADPFLMISGILLFFVNPVFFLIPATLFHVARKIFKSKLIPLLLLPFFWAFYEYLYMLTDASFPWLVLGNGMAKYTTFIQVADIVGAIGITVFVVLFNVLLFIGINYYKTERKIAFISIALFVFIYFSVLLYGTFCLDIEKQYEKVRVGIIQPNLDPWEKWSRSGIEPLFIEYDSLAKVAINEKAELLIFPETAFPVYLFNGRYASFTEKLYSFLDSNKVSLLTGMPHLIYYEENDVKPYDVKYSNLYKKYYATYNSIMLLNPISRNELQWYGKSKLVPFGERVPFVDQLPFLGDWIKWGVGISGWNKGTDLVVFNVPVKNKVIKVTGSVCYESIYPYYVSKFTELGAELITVVTNDSWYGNSSGPYQHRDFAILRAIENRRTVIRAANGGISCIIDPEGRIITQTGMFTKAALVADAPLNREITFFVKFPFVIPALICSVSISIILAGMYKKLKLKFKKK